MPKAILELEMPESCRECMFKECLNRTTSVEVSRCIILHKMHVPGSYCPAEGRQADCPLKLAENEQLQAQVARMWEALRKAREAIKAAWSDGSANAAMGKASEALAAIDKAIGGKEDAGKK